MDELPLHNSSRTIVRIFFWLTFFFAAVALAPQLVLQLQIARGAATEGVRATCNITTFIALPLGLAMLLAALLSIPVARQTDRSFAAFRAGEYVARWDYDPKLWAGYIQTEHRRVVKIGWVTYALVFAPSSAIVLFIICMVQSTLQGRIYGCLIAIAAIAAASGIYYQLARWIIAVRINAMTSCGHAFIGRNAVYAGGMYAFWGSQFRGLHSARILPGASAADPPVLELMVGLSRAARSTMRAIDIITLLLQSPAYTSSAVQRLAVLIPPGEETRAQEIIDLLFQPSTATPTGQRGETHHIPPPATAADLRRKSRGSALTSLLLFVGGLTLMLIGESQGIHTHSPRAAEALVVTGFLAWVACPITLILWIVRWTQARRAAKTGGVSA